MLDTDSRSQVATDVDLSWVRRQGIATAPWPPEGLTHGDRVTRHDHPLLYLVEPGDIPPPCGDLEDWIREPIDRAELFARAERLVAQSRRMAAHLTCIDDGDVLRVGPALVILSPIEARLMRVLVDHLREVVPRQVLIDAAWPDEVPSDVRALDNRVKSIRQKITELPLALHTVRGRGLLLERVAEVDVQ